MMLTMPVTEPFDLEVSPGVTVRDLANREECQKALFQLDMDMERIQAQIASSEANPGQAEPGWRTRAQAAIRWKKRTQTAIRDFAKRFDPPIPAAQRRYAAILDAIRQELGNEEFEFMMLKAKERHPKAFADGETAE